MCTVYIYYSFDMNSQIIFWLKIILQPAEGFILKRCYEAMGLQGL